MIREIYVNNWKNNNSVEIDSNTIFKKKTVHLGFLFPMNYKSISSFKTIITSTNQNNLSIGFKKIWRLLERKYQSVTLVIK